MLFQTLSPQHDNPLHHETESGLYTDVVVKAGAGVWRRPGSLLALLLGLLLDLLQEFPCCDKTTSPRFVP